MAKIINSPVKEGRIRLKKFYPGIVVSDKCPKCKCETKWADFMHYPSWGENAVILDCPKCETQWMVHIEISLVAKILTKEKDILL